MDLNVIPECYVDTKLVRIAAPPKRFYNHREGCTNVIGLMHPRNEKRKKGKLSDEFALGIIDKDKKIQDYIEEFNLVYDLPDALQLLKHPARHHYLIFVLPAVEKWLLTAAEEVNLSLTEFDLPHDLAKLCDITKTSKSENDDPYSNQLNRLFRELKRCSSARMLVLSLWITYLKVNPYRADMVHLVAETDTLCNP